jgi:hypothetical protein
MGFWFITWIVTLVETASLYFILSLDSDFTTDSTTVAISGNLSFFLSGTSRLTVVFWISPVSFYLTFSKTVVLFDLVVLTSTAYFSYESVLASFANVFSFLGLYSALFA